MVTKQRIFTFLILLFAFVSLFLAVRRGLDPDFGWHLRMGEIIMQKGIPATDPFSYTMSHYPFVDHEWLTNVVFSVLYPWIGHDGLAFLFTLIVFGTLCVQAFVSKSKWWVLPFLLSCMGLLSFVGIRPQILSWFFASLVVILATKDTLWRVYRWVLPLLMLVWVNMHGSFPFGLVLLSLIAFGHSIQAKKIIVLDWLIVGICLGVTFINPYGERIWWEVWMQMSDTALRWKIQEWLPTFSLPLYGFILFLPISVSLVFRYRKQFTLLELLLYTVLLGFGVLSARNAPYWLLIAIPSTARAIGYFYTEVKKDAISRQRFAVVYQILGIVITTILLLYGYVNIEQNRYSPLASYPQQVVANLKKHPPKGNVFAEYGWGGYLIWQMPEKKVFIDGRMPSWRTETRVDGDSANAFLEYLRIMRGSSRTPELFALYHIDTVIIKREDDTALVEFFEKLLSRELPLAKKKRLQEQLQKMGMKVTYSDDAVMVYQKL